MKTLTFEDRETWLAARRGKITGSRLKDIVVKRGTSKKLGFYELIAERIAIEPDGENPMDRGNRIEEEAVNKFEQELNIKVDQTLVIWCREDNESIAVSPDGYIHEWKAAVEVKCLSSARHIEAFLTKEIPDEYRFQIMQYFMVNDEIDRVYMVFYDPRIPCKEMFYLEINRTDMEEEIAQYLDYQKQILEEVAQVVNDLTF
jgi:putative phage-type endonuclease